MMVTKMIKEIMSKKIISGDIDSSFKDISKLMKENNIGFIPIKDKENFIGVITDRDICIALPEIENLNTSIKDYITNNIIYIDVSASFKEALEQMKKNKIKRLLVKENDKIDMYYCEDYYNYCYGTLANQTGKIEKFEIIKYYEGFLIR